MRMLRATMRMRRATRRIGGRNEFSSLRLSSGSNSKQVLLRVRLTTLVRSATSPASNRCGSVKFGGRIELRMPRATTRMLRATMRMLRATTRMLRATTRMLRATMRMLSSGEN
eukprot:7815674-Pyramimonas_sp.AAC.2